MKTDLGIVMIHWMMVVILLGALATGILLWDKSLQPYTALIFTPENMGVIHIGLSVAVVAVLLIYLVYLKHKNLMNHVAFRWRLVSDGRVLWGNIAILLYWMLFMAVVLETISGVLLTKLINQDVLARVFFIEKTPLLLVHLYLVFAILAFPVLHVAVHWLDGKGRKLFSIFKPRVFPSRPSLIDIMTRLKEENARLKKEKRKDVH